MNKPICITFAGTPGSSKTPVAYYLSWNLSLPVFNNDAIRTEVQEDTLDPDHEAGGYYLERRNQRLKQLIGSQKSFIFDASVDRSWPELKPKLQEYEYRWFIISFDLSMELLLKMAKVKNYNLDAAMWRKWQEEHKNFLRIYGDEINLRINDADFSRRLELSLSAAKNAILH